MAQFDVYLNPSKVSKEAYPYIVDIQSKLIAKINTRIVIPLGRLSRFKNQQLQGLTPIVKYKGEELLLLTPQISSLPARVLIKPIGSLSHLRLTILASLDFAISGI